MATVEKTTPDILSIGVLLSIFSVCIFISYVLATQSMYWATGAVLGVSLFAVGFFSPRISLYILIFSMLLSPEFGSRDVTGQGFTIRFEDLLLIVMGFAWLAKSALQKEVGLIVHTRLNVPIFLYIFACMISTGWGIINGFVHSPITGLMFVVKYVEYFVIFFLTINIVSSKSQLKSLLWAMFITYIIIIIFGFSQIPGGGRITAPFEGEGGEPNSLGGYLIIMLSLNITLFTNVKKLFYKYILGTLSLLCFIAILYTLSRATWLGLMVMYLFLIFFIKKRRILILALICGAVIAPLVMPDVVVDRLLYTFKKDRDVGILGEFSLSELEKMYRTQEYYDTSTQARLNSMKNALKDFQNHPILGYGVTGYEFLDAQYHRVLVETGLLGFCAFIYLLWVTGKLLLKNIKKYYNEPLYNTLSVGTFCAFMGLLAHAVGTNTFIIVRIMEPFWCLVALNLAIPILEGETEN